MADEEVQGDLKDLFQKGSSVHGRAATDTRVVTSKGDIDWDELATLNGYADKREMFQDLYVTRGGSMATVAARLGVSQSTVRIELGMVGITPRRRGGKRNTRGIALVEVALRKSGLSMEHLLILHETPYQVSRVLELKPHQVYSYIRSMKIPMPPLPKEAPDDLA